MSPEIVEAKAPLDHDAAVRLDKRIRLMAATVRENINKIAALVDEAKNGGIHVTLGFTSWTAYLADALGGQLELGTESRRTVVELLAGEGMSQRAIATVVGVSQKTVDRDLDHVSQGDSRDPVTGLDGKTYPPKDKPKKKPVTTDTTIDVEFAENLEYISGLSDEKFEAFKDFIAERLTEPDDELDDEVDEDFINAVPEYGAAVSADFINAVFDAAVRQDWDKPYELVIDLDDAGVFVWAHPFSDTSEWCAGEPVLDDQAGDVRLGGPDSDPDETITPGVAREFANALKMALPAINATIERLERRAGESR